MQTSHGSTPIMVCIQKLAVSLAQVYLGERDKLELPLQGLPLMLASSLQNE
jgi:CRISPR-associated protein Cas1